MLYLAEKKPATASTKDVAMVTGVVQRMQDCALALKMGDSEKRPHVSRTLLTYSNKCSIKASRCHHGAEAKCMNCAPLDP